MACTSLRHRGEEVLGVARPPGMPDVPWGAGIPLLHPWANRLGGYAYAFGGREVDLGGPLSPAIYVEEHELPLHGLREAVTGWEVTERGGQRLAARRVFAGVAGFPFDHELAVEAELVSPGRLTLTTTLTAAAGGAVPVAFGYHPYFRLPGVPRAAWEVRLPVRDRLVLDERLVPTGERMPAGELDGPLGERTFDDGYTLDEGGGPFVLRGGGRRVEVAFEHGYAFAQVFAPGFADVVCFEPMTAPADALRNAPEAVAPGSSYSARFSVAVLDEGDGSPSPA
jgi:aldose 1-epimerase